MYQYQIKLEDSGKYNIYYYISGNLYTIEFYAYDLNNPQNIIQYGYKEMK